MLPYVLVGLSGVVVHLAMLNVLVERGAVAGRMNFGLANLLAALVAIASNYLLNNEITYRDKRRRGPRLVIGLLRYSLFCTVGLVINLAVALQV